MPRLESFLRYCDSSLASVESGRYVPFFTEMSGAFNLSLGIFSYTEVTMDRMQLIWESSNGMDHTNNYANSYHRFLENNQIHYKALIQRGVKQLFPSLTLITVSYLYSTFLTETT